MSAQSRRARLAMACGVAFSLGLASLPLMIARSAAAQDVKIVDPNAPKAGQSPHDAAIAAAARGDYIAAVALAKQAAAAGQPLDADQVDYMTQKAAQQQAASADKAQTKAAQEAAQAEADKIMARQQKDYAARARRAALAAEANQPDAAQMAMQGQMLGGFAQSIGNMNGPHMGGGYETTAVNASKFATNSQPLIGADSKPATNCLTFDSLALEKGSKGAAAVASNKCNYKVVFLWCTEGGGDRACGRDGRPPDERSEVDAHGRLTLSDQLDGRKVRAWACAAPSVPEASATASFECR